MFTFAKVDVFLVAELLDLLLGEDLSKRQTLALEEAAESSLEGWLGVRRHKGLPCPYDRLAASADKEGPKTWVIVGLEGPGSSVATPFFWHHLTPAFALRALPSRFLRKCHSAPVHFATCEWQERNGQGAP